MSHWGEGGSSIKKERWGQITSKFYDKASTNNFNLNLPGIIYSICIYVHMHLHTYKYTHIYNVYIQCTQKCISTYNIHINERH